MPWFRVDDSFYDHPKAIAAEPALGLWLRAGCWSAKQLTDGFVPESMLHTFKATARKAQILVDARVRPDGAGLWVPVRGGWQFHDWQDYQPSRVETETKREKRALAGRVGGLASARTRQANAQANRSTIVDPPYIPPSRPVPSPSTRTPPPPSASAPPATKGTRIPDGFTPDPPMLAWVREKCPLVPASEHERFVDFWTAAAGAKGVKRDWPATWRTWMRRAQDDITTGRRPGARRSTTDDRVGQALSLRDKYAAIDAAEAEQQALATVTQLAIGDAS